MPESKKTKVLIVENSIGYTGAFKSIFSTAILLSDKIEFHFAIPFKSSNYNFIKENYPVIRIPFIEINRSAKIFLYIPFLLINSHRITRYCYKEKINIIHVNDLYNMVGVIVKFFHPDIKVIYHVRLLPNAFPDFIFSFWAKLVLRYADDIIAVSNIVKTNLEKWSDRKINIIYNTIPLAEKSDFDVKTKDGIVTLLYIANYTRGKGHDLALNAFIKAVKINPFIRLKFMGHDFGLKKNNIFKEELINTVKKNNIEAFVEFIEPTTEIEKIMKESEIVLNFSEAESFSMTCYEALYYGRPLIATDCGGPSELFEHGISGWLVPNKNINLMTEAIVLLSSDNSLRDELGKKAKEHISNFIKKNNIKEQELNIYMNILK